MVPRLGFYWTAANAIRDQRSYATAVRITLGLLAGLGLVLAFVRLVNFGSVLKHVEHLNVTLALLCGIVFLAAYVVRALRWHRFLAPYPVSIPRAIAIYQIAIFVNWLLPVRGGELVKSLLLRRMNGIPVSRSLPTVTMDKSMDLLPAVGLLVLLPFVQLQLSPALWSLLLPVLALLLLGALTLALMACRRDVALTLLTRLMRCFPARFRGRVEPFVIRFLDTLLGLVKRPRLLLIATAYTAVAVFLDAIFCLLAFQAVGADIAFPVVLYGYTFYNLAYILPTPPGQIGSNELVGLLIFSGLFHVGRPLVAAMFLFSHPWTALLMSGSGLLCLSGMGLTLRTTLSLSHSAEPVEAASSAG